MVYTATGTSTALLSLSLDDILSEMEIYDIPVINNEPSFLFNEPGIYRPVIIPGATIPKDSLKDKIKAKYIRAGPKKYTFDNYS